MIESIQYTKEICQRSAQMSEMVMLYCYRNAGGCSKADAVWTSVPVLNGAVTPCSWSQAMQNVGMRTFSSDSCNGTDVVLALKRV